MLFQDIAVIAMLALIPLLALPELLELAGTSREAAHDDHGIDINLVAGLAGWQQALATLAAVAAVFVAGRWLIRPPFHYIAMAQRREIFVAAALMIVVSIALLMMVVGLSPALGAFMAGVVLANSEYRHELESDVTPFKGFLLGLFLSPLTPVLISIYLPQTLGSIFSLSRR